MSLCLCGSLFFYRLGDRELTSSHEARAAQNAQQMINTGDWSLPHLFDRRAELQKPPLYYWLVAALAQLSGGHVDAWMVRLPAALAALATVLLVALIGRWCGRPRMGLIAAIILATSLHFTWMARVGRIDMPLTLTVTAALTGFYFGRRRLHERGGKGAWGCFLASYIAVAVGLLLKGPIAAVLPAAVAGGWWMVDGGWWKAKQEQCSSAPSTIHHPPSTIWKRIHAYGLWWGLPLTIALAVPWYLRANATTSGEFFRVFFWHHNFERGFGGEGGLAAHPWWFYGPRLLIDLLPWSVLLPLLAWRSVGRRTREPDPEARFAAVWLFVVLALLSCMRFKRADYLLPAYPGTALLLGCAVERWWLRQGRHIATAFALVAAACVAGWLGYLEYSAACQAAARPDRRFAAAIRRHTSSHVIFFRAEAHAVAFHVGRPLHTVLEWENLDVWAGKPTSTYIVMPAECAAVWRQHLTAGRLVEVLRTTDLTRRPHERPLVLLRTAAHSPIEAHRTASTEMTYGEPRAKFWVLK